MSVQNQNAADGWRVRRVGASAVGSTVPRKGAKAAISTIASTSAPPMAIAGWRRMKPMMPPRSLTGGSRSGSSGAAEISSGAVVIVASVNSGSSVEHGVEQVDDEIDEHVKEAEH